MLCCQSCRSTMPRSCRAASYASPPGAAKAAWSARSRAVRYDPPRMTRHTCPSTSSSRDGPSTPCMMPAVRAWKRYRKTAAAASAARSGPTVSAPWNQAVNAAVISAVNPTAVNRGQTAGSRSAAAAHAARRAGRTAVRMSSAATLISSRSAAHGRSSRTAACRSATSSGPAGVLSQPARASSPACVRAVHRSWKSEPPPNRSRSCA